MSYIDLSIERPGVGVMRRDGSVGRLISTDVLDWSGRTCLVAFQDVDDNESICRVKPTGAYHIHDVESDYDIVSVEREHRVMIRIIKNPDGHHSVLSWHEDQTDWPILSDDPDDESIVSTWILEIPGDA